jgi:hypothetical protein
MYTSAYLEGMSVEAVPRDKNFQIFLLKYDVMTHTQYKMYFKCPDPQAQLTATCNIQIIEMGNTLNL